MPFLVTALAQGEKGFAWFLSAGSGLIVPFLFLVIWLPRTRQGPRETCSH